MFYFKRLIHSLLALTIIVTLSACSSTAPSKTTKEAAKESTQKVVTSSENKTAQEPPIPNTQNNTPINVNKQLDELFTPAVGLF